MVTAALAVEEGKACEAAVTSTFEPMGGVRGAV